GQVCRTPKEDALSSQTHLAVSLLHVSPQAVPPFLSLSPGLTRGEASAASVMQAVRIDEQGQRQLGTWKTGRDPVSLGAADQSTG
ncbi:MAG TPA: hypothetical protein VF784_06840, partial [Anaerolineales bacterium]